MGGAMREKWLDETTKSAIRELTAGTAIAVTIASGIAFIVVSAIY